MDEYEISTYPSRAFIRFAARNQLIADLTGRGFPLIVKRFGGESYVQKVTPSDQPETEQPGSNSFDINPSDLGMSPDFFNPNEKSGEANFEQPRSQESQSSGQHDEAASLGPNCDPAQQAATIDEALFREITQTVFNLNHSPELYQASGTKRAAAAVEARIAEEIVETYKQIKLKQECPIVQSLNALL
ncbi:MAG: hypothetical protein MJA27_01010 [Pseudanabaenales cyanobacterium]|nr:hypothetical protein [Pseudanabaenales cyanobacterium]